jgi:hypothetical protein
MQIQGNIIQSVGRYSSQRNAANRRFVGNKHVQKNEAGSGKSKNDFLKHLFRPIPQTRFNPLFNRGSYDFLYRSARNYSNLLGSSFDRLPDEKDFAGLFRYFKSRLPERQHLLLTEENKKLSFKVWFGADFLINEVFFIPIQLLNRTEGVFRDIFLTFFQHFQQMHRFPKKNELYDYEIIVVCYFEEWYGQDDDPEVREFLKTYKEGYINDTFSLIYQKPGHSIEELEKLVENYSAKNEVEQKLMASIRQGINILLMNKSIFEFVRRPGENDENFYGADDDCIIEAERLIRFVYSGNDYVSESYLEYINTESMDSANEYFPRKSIVLSPDTDRLLEVDFVECFFTWLSDFIRNLYDYEQIK